MLKAGPITIFLAAVALLGYLGIVILGPVHIAHMAQMDVSMEHCPFATDEHSLCLMSLDEHLAAWQSFIDIVLPAAQIFFLIVGIVVLQCLWFYSLPILKQALYAKWQRSNVRLQFLQHLFSQGILNSKAP